jgi:hypothetical protein
LLYKSEFGFAGYRIRPSPKMSGWQKMRYFIGLYHFEVIIQL